MMYCAMPKFHLSGNHLVVILLSLLSLRIWNVMEIRNVVLILCAQSKLETCSTNMFNFPYRTIKAWTNTVMNRSGAPANSWLLCHIHVCYLLSHIACVALDGKIPLFTLTSITSDISILLLFTFYQPVSSATHDEHFPSESEEIDRWCVGFGEHCGDAMTHVLFDHETQKIFYRSAVRPQKYSSPNYRLAPHGGEVSTSSDPSEDTKFHLDHHWDLHRFCHQSKRRLQSSRCLKMMRIHLDPSLCQLLTEKISLGEHFFLKKMVKGIEPR